MKYLKLFYSIFPSGLCPLWLLFLNHQPIGAQENPPAYVVLVSFDGFRNDYVEKFDALNFNAFIEHGAAAAGLIPSFPSKTFPNHYTIVTGMYPGHHGLVDNTFYDKTQDKIYSTSNRTRVEDTSFYGGLPLWQLAQQNGLKTASYFWVGSEAPVQGQYPSYYYLYDGSTPNTERVDQTIRWLQLPDSSRPRFISLYFSLIDDVGHEVGPNAPALGQEVLVADQILGRLMAGIDSLPIPVNVILCSDHGMLEMQAAAETYILLDELPGYSDSTLIWQNNGTHVHIYYRDTTQRSRLEETLITSEQHFKTWTHSNFPNRWHYQHERVGDILLLADPGFYFTRSTATHWKQLAEGQAQHPWGTHGFDPGVCPEMQGIFYAMGPGIKPGAKVPSFENIHIYPFIATLLGLPIPEGIDGRSEVLRTALKKK